MRAVGRKEVVSGLEGSGLRVKGVGCNEALPVAVEAVEVKGEISVWRWERRVVIW